MKGLRMDILNLPPAERLRALQEHVQWIHKGRLDLDYGDIIHVYSHSLTKRIALVKDTKGWATTWDFCQTLDGRNISERQKNEEVTNFLRLAQEDLMSHKYGPEAGKELEFRRKHRTPTLGGTGRYGFFRELEKGRIRGYWPD